VTVRETMSCRRGVVAIDLHRGDPDSGIAPDEITASCRRLRNRSEP